MQASLRKGADFMINTRKNSNRETVCHIGLCSAAGGALLLFALATIITRLRFVQFG